MRHKRRKINGLIFLLAVFLSAYLTGCMGPTTRVLPRAPERQSPDYVDMAPSREDVNAFYLWETVEFLSEQTREMGSLGAAMTSDYMKQLLTDYGYQTTVSGGIVSAVRTVDSQEADIVILASNYGSLPDSPGASDNASGIAVFLETARLAAEIPTSDTELRFVAFPGAESGWEAAHMYVNSLTPEEKRRTLGVVQIGPLGYAGSRTIVLGTENGQETFLGDQINEAALALTGTPLSYEIREGGSPAVFWRGEIPAVYLVQRDEAYEDGTVLDRLEWINVDQMVPAVNMLRRMLTDLMGEDTPSMIAKSHHYNDLRDGAYVQGLEAAIPFGQDRRELERRTGLTGTLHSQNTANDGRPIEAYQYPMKWFEVDQILMSDYYFVDGKLQLVSLEADEAGVDTEDMKERITSIYGEPYAVSEGPDGTEYRWSDPFCRLNIVMVPNSDGYELEIREFDTQRTELSPENNKQAESLMELIWQIIPEEEEELISVSIYTDGIGKTDHYLELAADQQEDIRERTGEEDENVPGRSWILGIDLEDAVRKDGSLRSRTKTVRRLVNLYGQILAQRSDRGYREAFDAQFSSAVQPETEDLEDGSLEEDVNSGGLEEDVNSSVFDEGPDFAESFQWYVLVKDPKILTGEWGERIRFFEAYEELAEYRDQVRENLQLPEIEEVVVGVAP